MKKLLHLRKGYIPLFRRKNQPLQRLDNGNTPNRFTIYVALSMSIRSRGNMRMEAPIHLRMRITKYYPTIESQLCAMGWYWLNILVRENLKYFCESSFIDELIENYPITKETKQEIEYYLTNQK